MSTRPLGGGPGGGHEGKVQQIENMADAKGVEVDEIEVEETETDDGKTMVRFLVYETKAETEEDSVGIQVTTMPDSPLSEQNFRTQVQNKLSALKSHLMGTDGKQQEIEQIDEELENRSPGESMTDRPSASEVGAGHVPDDMQPASGTTLGELAENGNVEINIYIDGDEEDIDLGDPSGLAGRVEKIENALESMAEVMRVPGFGDDAE